MEKTKKKFSYTNFHTLVFVIASTPVTLYVFCRIQGKTYGDKLSILIGMAVLAVLQAFVQYNLAKANRITLCIVLTVLFGAVLVNDYLVKGLICSDFCWITVMGAIALRSLLFMFFDAPAGKDTEEE